MKTTTYMYLAFVGVFLAARVALEAAAQLHSGYESAVRAADGLLTANSELQLERDALARALDAYVFPDGEGDASRLESERDGSAVIGREA